MNKVNDSAKKMSLFVLTWPIFIEVLLHMLIGSTDTFMLAHFSDDAVAAVGVANQLVFFMIILFGMIATGTSVVVSQYLGARMFPEANKVAAISVTINVIFGLLISLFVVGFRGTFLSFYSLPKHVNEYADQYLLIVGSTLVFQAVLVTVSATLRANGYTKDAMFVSIGMNIIHVFGNYLVIYGAFGMPVLGVTGVAISTAVSRAIAMVAIFILLYRRLTLPIVWRDYFRFNLDEVKKILKIGVPTAGEQLSYNTSQMMITSFITLIGTAALTTRIYTISIMSFIFLFGIAMGQGTQILIGHMVGAGKNYEAYHQLFRSLRLSLLVTLIVAILVGLSGETLISIFTDDAEIISVGGMLLLMCIILEPGRTFNLVVISSLRATGDAQFPVLMGILSMWGIAVPLSYFLGIYLGYGLPGVWVSFIVDEWFRGILMVFRWRSRVWEKKVLVRPQEQPDLTSS